MTTTETTPTMSPTDAPVPDARVRIEPIAVTVVFCVALFGDILAFNQLATQSPIDANLMILVFTVGLAGAFEGMRRIALGRDTTARLVGAVVVTVAVIAIVAWAGRWPTELQGIIVILAGVVIGLLSSSLLWRQRNDTTSEVARLAGLLALCQAIVAVWFGALAITALGS